MVVARVARGAAVREVVHHRLAALQHPAHHRLGLGAVDPGQHLGEPSAQRAFDAQAVGVRQRLVQPDEAQVGVEHRHAHRGLGEEPVEEGQVGLEPVQRGHLGGDRQHHRGAAGAEDRMGAELQVHQVPVPVPDREDPGPGPARQDLPE